MADAVLDAYKRTLDVQHDRLIQLSAENNNLASQLKTTADQKPESIVAEFVDLQTRIHELEAANVKLNQDLAKEKDHSTELKQQVDNSEGLCGCLMASLASLEREREHWVEWRNKSHAEDKRTRKLQLHLDHCEKPDRPKDVSDESWTSHASPKLGNDIRERVNESAPSAHPEDEPPTTTQRRSMRKGHRPDSYKLPEYTF